MGKSCLVHRFVSDSFNASSPPTIGSVRFDSMKYLSPKDFITIFIKSIKLLYSVSWLISLAF